MKKCVFAGTFDPFTVGHLDTVEKSLKVFDETVVAVSENKKKACLFSAKERKEMIEAVFAEQKRVKVVVWDGVIADLLKKESTPFYVRGVRNAVDFEYETNDFYASRDLDETMITLYFPAEKQDLYISSTLVKNCIAFQKPFDRYVPEAVARYLQKRLGAGK